MRLSSNEIKIINTIREAKSFSKINITKKAGKDRVEYQMEVRTSQFLSRELDETMDNLL